MNKQKYCDTCNVSRAFHRYPLHYDGARGTTCSTCLRAQTHHLEKKPLSIEKTRSAIPGSLVVTMSRAIIPMRNQISGEIVTINYPVPTVFAEKYMEMQLSRDEHRERSYSLIEQLMEMEERNHHLEMQVSTTRVVSNYSLTPYVCPTTGTAIDDAWASLSSASHLQASTW